MNLFSLLCDENSTVDTASLGTIKKFGGPIAYLIIYSLILFAILVWVDSGSKLPRRLPILRKRGPLPAISPETSSAEEEVLQEAKATEDSNDPLRVLHVSKTFGGSHVKAVDDVSFNVAQDTVLALLGPNGAGKTSTFNIIRVYLSLYDVVVEFESKHF